MGVGEHEGLVGRGLYSILIYLCLDTDKKLTCKKSCEMPKNKPSGGGGWGVSGTDWSDTGTFVRKPSSGWLHSETDLNDGAYVKYRLTVS